MEVGQRVTPDSQFLYTGPYQTKTGEIRYLKLGSGGVWVCVWGCWCGDGVCVWGGVGVGVYMCVK